MAGAITWGSIWGSIWGFDAWSNIWGLDTMWLFLFLLVAGGVTGLIAGEADRKY